MGDAADILPVVPGTVALLTDLRPDLVDAGVVAASMRDGAEQADTSHQGDPENDAPHVAPPFTFTTWMLSTLNL